MAEELEADDPDQGGKGLERPGHRHRGEAGETALRSEHYWVYWFEQPDGVGLRDYLKILMGKLAEHRSVFDKVTSTQGRVQLFITLPAGKSAGEVLDWQVLQKLAEMRIDLAFEVYHQG